MQNPNRKLPADHLVNVDFDLSLRPRPGVVRHDFKRQAEELARHFVAGGLRRDRLLLRSEIPASFLEYLDAREVPRRQPVRSPELGRARLAPFGWSAEAMTWNALYAQPAAHPTLDVIIEVNSRAFSAGLEAELDPEGPALGFFGDVADVERALLAAGDSPGGFVMKAAHANSALGHRHLETARLGDEDRAWLEAQFAEDDGVALERWESRELDLAATFEVDQEGTLGRFAVHEVQNTFGGAFVSALFGGKRTKAHEEELEAAATKLASALARAGYFGPVCIDAYVTRSGRTKRLRPLVDVNARRQISEVGQSLWRMWGAKGVATWRFYTVKKLALPAREEEFADALGESAFDLRTRRGVLLTSPLPEPDAGSAPDKPRPYKLSALFAGKTRKELEALEARFAESFGR